MIALYPLLISNTVSKNIIPGVCKSLENYILVYNLDSIMRGVRHDSGIKGAFSVRNNKVRIKEDMEENLTDFLYQELLDEAGRSGIYNRTGPGTKNMPARPGDADFEDKQGPKSGVDKDREAAYDYNEKLKDAERMARAKEKGKLSAQPEDKAKNATIKLDAYNTQALTIEPTWMKADVYRNGIQASGVIGVKVVPYAVKSDAELSQLLMYDRQVSKMMALAIKAGRWSKGFLYRTWMRAWTKIPFVGGSSSGTVTGDPRKDILVKRNFMSASSMQDVFVLANQAELADDFYDSPGLMTKLQSMGWGSIIIADDVNRRVAFCMRELNGMCSMIPYTMLYQTFSQAKVYEDLEDAKRNASSIFKVRRERMSRIIGEHAAYDKIQKFSAMNLFEHKDSDALLTEAVVNTNPNDIKRTLLAIASRKKTNLPNVSTEKLVANATKRQPEFRKGYMLAKKVLANSAPDVSEKMIELGAISIAIRATVVKTEDFMNEIKLGVKQIIGSFRKLKGKADPDKVDLPKSHYGDAVFGWITIIMSTVIISYLLKFLSPLIKDVAGMIKFVLGVVLSMLNFTWSMLSGTWTLFFGGREGVADMAKDFSKDIIGNTQDMVVGGFWVLASVLLVKMVFDGMEAVKSMPGKAAGRMLGGGKK